MGRQGKVIDRQVFQEIVSTDSKAVKVMPQSSSDFVMLPIRNRAKSGTSDSFWNIKVTIPQ